MDTILSAVLLILGLHWLIDSRYPSVYRPAARALKGRGPRALSQTEVVVRAMARKLEGHVHLDPIKHAQLQETLRNLGRSETPEAFQANAMARALLMCCAFLWLPLFSVPLGAMAIALTFFAVYQREQKQLHKQLQERRQRIERELPQFAGTIRQSLNSTRDLVAILSNYRKISGPVLAGEIDKTLNDIMTGNAERAIKALEGRVASPKLGQVTRGLQAVLRGDDQRVYFDVLAAEFRKAQDEMLERVLLDRPKELHPHLAVLFGCLLFMIAMSVGADLTQQMGVFF